MKTKLDKMIAVLDVFVIILAALMIVFVAERAF
jgi:hypothetical protein